MTYTQGGLIEARDFNSKAQYINNVWGPGSGSTGYGQPNLLTTVSVHALITATNWATMIARLDLITNHQSGTPTGITRPATGDLIAFINTLNGKISSSITNKLHTDSRGVDLPTYLGNPAIANNAPWTANSIKEFSVVFGDENKLRYFFNCGGLISFYMTLTGGDNQKSTNVSGFLATQMGQISFGSNLSFRSGTGGYATIDNTTLGYWRLEGFYQTVFTGVSTLDTNYQALGFYAIVEAKKGNIANKVTFKISLFDPAPDSFTNAVNGTLKLFVGYTPPETTYLTDVWGTPTLIIESDTQGPAPIPPPTYTIVPDKTSINEGQTVTYTVTTTNYGTGILFWKDVGGRPAQDFDDNAIDGTVNIAGDSGTITRTPSENNQTDGVTYIKLRLRDGNTDAAIALASAVDVTINDTSLTPLPGYSINPNRLFVDEGSTVTFTVTTSNLANNTILYWTMAGTATAEDFTDVKDNDSVTIVNNSGTIPRPVLADHLTEGPQTFLLQLRTGSKTGAIVATSPTVTINDTSVYDPGPPPPPPTQAYSIVPDKTNVDEGDTVTYTITTTNFGRAGNGTLYWTNAGTTVAADFEDNTNSGVITITNNSGTLPRKLLADNFTEGPENIIIQLRTNSLTGTLVAIADPVIVNDTSKTVIPDPVLLSAAITPTSAVSPGNFTVSWAAQNADRVTVSGGAGGTGSFTDLNGTMKFTEAVIGSYTKTVTALNTATGKTSAPRDLNYVVTAVPLSRGTLIDTFCKGVDQWGHYADGSGGQYDQQITVNSPACGYVAPPPPPTPTPYNTLLSTFCKGVDQWGHYADGNFGTFDRLITANSTDCGYVAPPPPPPPPPPVPLAKGTYVSERCDGYTKVTVYADGNFGTYETPAYNSPDCGYVAPPPPPPPTARGTLLNTECRGTAKWGIYADGAGGTYPGLIQNNSPECGYTPPPVPPPPPPPTVENRTWNFTLSQLSINWHGWNYKACKAVLGDNPTGAPSNKGTIWASWNVTGGAYGAASFGSTVNTGNQVYPNGSENPLTFDQASGDTEAVIVFGYTHDPYFDYGYKVTFTVNSQKFWGYIAGTNNQSTWTINYSALTKSTTVTAQPHPQDWGGGQEPPNGW